MPGRHRRAVARPKLPARRGPRPLGITDAQTRVEHLVSEESVREHRHLGRYRTLCGVQVLAASLVTAPDRGHCPKCATWSAS